MTRTIALDEAAWASPWRRHRVGPKLALATGLVVEALVLPAPVGIVLVSVIAAATLLGPARVPAGVLGRALTAPAVFIALGAASVLVSISWSGGPQIGLAPDGPRLAASIVGHAVAGTLSVFVLAATTPMVDLLGWLRARRVPEPLVEIAELVYRSLFVLLESVRAVTEAQTSRLGYASRSAALRSSTELMGSLFVRAWTRSRRLETGLVGRGYAGALRTLDPEYVAGLRPVVVTGLLAGIALVGVAASQWLSWAS